MMSAPSHIVVSIDGEQVGTFTLPDNPSDSRGVLSYQYQEIYNKLDEAGSYGYLCRITVPSRIAAKLNRSRSFKLLRSGSRRRGALRPQCRALPA